jgi:hypothetical protein
MPEKKREVFLLVVLVVVVAYAGYIYWPAISSYLPKAKPSAVTTTTRISINVSTEAEAVASQEAITSPEAKTGELIDPFQIRVKVTPKVVRGLATLAHTEEAKPASPHLEGIWVDANMKVAFISGQTVMEGDKVLGWQVVRIQKNLVIITKGNKQKILKLEVIQ